MPCRITWVMQQGSYPEHTSRSTSKWLTKTKMKVLGWLSQSLDLNVIEMLGMTSNIPFMLENPPVKQYFIFWRGRVLFPHIKYYMKDKSRASQQQRGFKRTGGFFFFFSLFWPRSGLGFFFTFSTCTSSYVVRQCEASCALMAPE